jgi:hypothetical protein
VDWYHNYLGHPGINRTEEQPVNTYGGLICEAYHFIGIYLCKSTEQHKKYGHLPRKGSRSNAWDKMCIDLIGPYTINKRQTKSPLFANVSP